MQSWSKSNLDVIWDIKTLTWLGFVWLPGQAAAMLTTARTGPAHHTLFSLRFSAKRFEKRAPWRFEPSTSKAMHERANHPGQHPLRDNLFFYFIFNNAHFFCARLQLVCFFWPFFFFFQFRELFLSLWIFFVSVNFFSNLLNSWTFQNNENFLNLMNFSSWLTFQWICIFFAC